MGLQIEETNRSIIYIDPSKRDTASERSWLDYAAQITHAMAVDAAGSVPFSG